MNKVTISELLEVLMLDSDLDHESIADIETIKSKVVAATMDISKDILTNQDIPVADRLSGLLATVAMLNIENFVLRVQNYNLTAK